MLTVVSPIWFKVRFAEQNTMPKAALAFGGVLAEDYPMQQVVLVSMYFLHGIT